MMKFFFKILDAYDRIPEPRRFWTFFGTVCLFLIIANIIAFLIGIPSLVPVIVALMAIPVIVIRFLHLRSGRR